MYPSTIDIFRRVIGYITGNPVDANKLKAGDQNNMADTLEAVQNTLGLNPQGGYASVVARLLAIETKLNFEYDYTTHAQSSSTIGWNIIKTQTINVQNASNFFISVAWGNIRNNDSRVNLCQFQWQDDFGGAYPISADELDYHLQYGHFCCCMLDENLGTGNRDFKLRFNPQRSATIIENSGLITFGFYT